MEGCKSWKLSLIFSSETSAHPTAYMKNFREWKKKRNTCYKHVIRCWINLGYTNLKTVGLFWGVLLAFVCSQIKKKIIVLTESETTICFPWLLVCGCLWFNYSTKQSVLCKFLISELSPRLYIQHFLLAALLWSFEGGAQLPSEARTDSCFWDRQ